jgi:hypothetical protein
MESYALSPGLPIDTAHVTSTDVTEEQVHAAHITVRNIDRADVAASHDPPRDRALHQIDASKEREVLNPPPRAWYSSLS